METYMETYKGVECRRVDADLLSVVETLSIQPLTSAELRVIQADIDDVIDRCVPFSSVRAVIYRMLLPGRSDHPTVIDADDESTELGVSDKQLVQWYAGAAGCAGYKMDEFCHRAYEASRELRDAGVLAHEFRWSGKAQQPGSFAEEENRKEEAEESEETFIDIGCGDFVEKGKFDMRTILLDQIKFFRELQKKAAEDDPSDAAAIIKYSDHIIYLFDDLIERIEDE